MKLYINWNRHSYANRNLKINWPNPWYGILKKVLPPLGGQRVHCFLTFVCNLDCGYCTLKFADGEMPVSDTMTLEEWKEVLGKQFPRPIKEVIISGGEPMLMPYFSDLVNWLLHDQKKFVCVFSNLMTTGGLEVKPSVRYRIHATYHHSAKLERFEKHLALYQKKYRVNIDEIMNDDTPKLVTQSWRKPYIEKAETEYCRGFFYSPEGRLFTNFNTIDRHYAKINVEYKGYSENQFRKERQDRSLKVIPTSGL